MVAGTGGLPAIVSGGGGGGCGGGGGRGLAGCQPGWKAPLQLHKTSSLLPPASRRQAAHRLHTPGLTLRQAHRHNSGTPTRAGTHKAVRPLGVTRCLGALLQAARGEEGRGQSLAHEGNDTLIHVCARSGQRSSRAAHSLRLLEVLHELPHARAASLTPSAHHPPHTHTHTPAQHKLQHHQHTRGVYMAEVVVTAVVTGEAPNTTASPTEH